MDNKDFIASLHSINKPPSKPWRKPDQLPAPPRVYRVEPRGFRDLVQKLTGKPPRQLRESITPPPPLELENQRFMEGKMVNSGGPRSPTAGLMSPSFYSSWCNFPLLSPASMAGFDGSNGAIL
ncbi:hypothetical protein LUZ60_005027 [Juncus effusus]|nr:hypothetical protein LUZ60_005027 [Juncus effusus]